MNDFTNTEGEIENPSKLLLPKVWYKVLRVNHYTKLPFPTLCLHYLMERV